MSSPGPPALQRLHHLDRSSSGFHGQLNNVPYEEEYQKCVPELLGNDLVWLVDYLDEALDEFEVSSPTFRKCLRELRRICGTRRILPTSYGLSSRRLDIASGPFTSGGYGDTHKGIFNGSGACVKCVRMHTKGWCRIGHRNLLSGGHYVEALDTPKHRTPTWCYLRSLQLVLGWISGGDLPDYIRKNPDADRLGLLSDVAEGLCYPHSCNIVHGNLKGPNILIDDSRRGRITEFGLARATQSVSRQHVHTARWAAPEILNEGPHSKEADVFSFAMFMIEVFSGVIPFSNTPSVTAVLAVTQSERPPRPTHPTFTANLWTLMQRYWDSEPRVRPDASEAMQILLTLERPAWKQLISHTLATDERTALVVKIFSDHDEAEMVGQLYGDDAQAFLDAVSETRTEDPQGVFAGSNELQVVRPSNPPVLTGFLKLSITGLAPIAHRLLSLPGGIHFRKIRSTRDGEEDIPLITALVERCSHTLESLDIAYHSLVGSTVIDLSKATKLRDAVFRPELLSVKWITTTLKTITTKHRELQRISICIPYNLTLPNNVEALKQSTTYGEWIDLDRLLVQIWESHSTSPKVVCITREGRMWDWGCYAKCLLPELRKRGVIDLVG